MFDDIYNPYLTYEDVMKRLMYQIEHVYYSQSAFADENSISRSYVNDVVMHRKKPGKKILNALYLEEVTYYVHKEK